MENILTPMQGILLLLAFGVAMFFVAMLNRRKYSNDGVVEFVLASRSVGIVVGAASATISWIWAPILFVGAQKAYEQGLLGLLLFALPNSGAMVLFAFIAYKVRKNLPFGYTLPEYMQKHYGRGVYILYLVQFVLLQVASFAVQVLGGATLISLMTGLSFYWVAFMMVAIVFMYSVVGGLRASIRTDVLQMALLLGGVLLVVPLVIYKAGGLGIVMQGLGGINGIGTGSSIGSIGISTGFREGFLSIFDRAPWVVYSFGIPVMISLLAGPMGDQMHWQRAFAYKSAKTVKKAYVLGASVHICIIFALASLGFIAASYGKVIEVHSAQMVGPIVVAHFLPTGALVLFSVMLLAGLCSTLDSIFCAVSSLAVGAVKVNSVYKKVRIARLSMLVVAIVGGAVACIPKLEIFHLFLLAGTLRAATFIPSVLAAMQFNIKSKNVFKAILCSLLFASPIYVVGTIIANPHLVVLGSVLPIILGLAFCGTSQLTKKLVHDV